jgi:hypothetical protein
MAILQPLLILVEPWQDPPNTFRAQTVKEMYSIAAKPTDFNILYEVGRAPTIAPHLFAFRNNTESNDLQLDLELPPYWTCDQELPMTILRNTTATFNLLFSEPFAKLKSATNSHVYPDEIVLTITPLLVNGPVYVYNNLPVLTV